MKSTLRLAGLAGASLLLSAVAAWAGPKIVSGPGANPTCFKPWSDQTKFFQWPKKPGPYRIALVNGWLKRWVGAQKAKAMNQQTVIGD